MGDGNPPKARKSVYITEDQKEWIESHEELSLSALCRQTLTLLRKEYDDKLENVKEEAVEEYIQQKKEQGHFEQKKQEIIPNSGDD